MFLPNALLKALAQVRPDAAMAEGSGAVWTMQVSGNHDDGSPFITAMFTYAGGVGARATKPGLDACSYPTGVAAVPIEVVEASAPIRFRTQGAAPRLGRRRRARPAGSARRSSSTVDTDPAVAAQRRHEPPGRARRRASSAARPAPPAGSASTASRVTTQARITLQPGDVVRLELPGRRRATGSSSRDGDATGPRHVRRRVAARRDGTRPSEPFLRFDGADGARHRVDLRRVRPRRRPGAAAAWRRRRRPRRRGAPRRSRNSPTFVAAWLAAIRLGAWIVPSDPMSTTAELTEHISRTDAGRRVLRDRSGPAPTVDAVATPAAAP